MEKCQIITDMLKKNLGELWIFSRLTCMASGSREIEVTGIILVVVGYLCVKYIPPFQRS